MVLVVAAACESLLWIGSGVSFRVRQWTAPLWLPPTVVDDILGYRPNPLIIGHDRSGFRNARVPDRADIVALGDSHTYGWGVAAGDAWPRRLQELGDDTVYSMAYGGYGPVHASLMIDEALDKSPRVVIIAVYSGNDAFDAFRAVYEEGRRPEYATTGAAALTPEAKESFQARVALAEGMGRPVALSSPPDHTKLIDYTRTRRLYWRARHFLRTPDAVAKAETTWQQAKAVADAHPDRVDVLDDGRFRTVFTPAYRLTALDMTEPCVEEGWRIAMTAIADVAGRCREAGAVPVVLFVPTKEFVFVDHVMDASHAYRSLIENESTFLQRTSDYLQQRHIGFVDATPALRAVLANGVQPYPVSSDGHPNAVGHRAIAGSVLDHIEDF
jgi:hypothetical protein